MALIDALMAGQQFVSGIQQQQQMAREYRDRMAMLAREEERAMRQEERQTMADFRTQGLQDFEMGLARSAEERAQKQFERQGVTTKLTQEQLGLSIEADRLRIAELEREAENAGTIEEREKIEFELRERLTRVQLAEAEAAQSARIAAGEAEKEFGRVQSALTDVARQVQINPAALTADQALSAERIMYDFIDRNPQQVQALSPYYNSFFSALEEAEKAKGSLLTKRGLRAEFDKDFVREGIASSFTGGLTSYGQTALPNKEYTRERRNFLEPRYEELEKFRNLRDRRENFLSIIGRPMSDALVGMLPQED